MEPFDAGTCLPTLKAGGCEQPPATCSDGSAWYFRTVGHSLEVIDAGSTCFDLSDFEPCPLPTAELGGGADTGTGTDTDADTDAGESSGGWEIDELIAAVCACPCGQDALSDQTPHPSGSPIPWHGGGVWARWAP